MANFCNVYSQATNHCIALLLFNTKRYYSALHVVSVLLFTPKLHMHTLMHCPINDVIIMNKIKNFAARFARHYFLYTLPDQRKNASASPGWWNGWLATHLYL